MSFEILLPSLCYLRWKSSNKEQKIQDVATVVHYGPDDSIYFMKLAALAQMVACLPLVQRVRGSIPGGVVNFHLKVFNVGARRGGDVHFLIARLYITLLD